LQNTTQCKTPGGNSARAGLLRDPRRTNGIRVALRLSPCTTVRDQASCADSRASIACSLMLLPSVDAHIDWLSYLIRTESEKGLGQESYRARLNHTRPWRKANVAAAVRDSTSSLEKILVK
jgi:hypothetical protein